MKKYLLFLLVSIVFAFDLGCKKEEEKEKSSEKEILSFVVEGQIDEAVINSEDATVAILMPDSVNLTSIAPEITISEKATIDPESAVEVDFSQGPVTYTVTAENNSTKDWQVTMSNFLSSEAEILSFQVPNQVGETVFEGTNIYAEIRYGLNLHYVTPTIVISEHAGISPELESELDFSSGPVEYTVTAQDGTQKIWMAYVGYAPNHNTDIISFNIPEQVGESVIGDNSVNVEVPFGTNLSALTPVIEVSYGATITPASGETVDFSATGSVEYIVTSENGENTAVWTAYVRYPIIKADDPNFEYVGRFDFSDPEKPRVWAPGAYIMAKFTGAYCEISLVDEVRYNSNYNFLQIVIDGTQNIRVRTYGANNIIDISDYLTEGEHTLLICKSTESEMGYIDFIGLYLESNDALLTPDDLPTRKIEFIGNSIACGSGIDLSLSAGVCGGWFDNHNAYLSYGPRTARTLNARWHISARSGMGLIQSCCGSMYTLPDIYYTTEIQLNGTEWDFNQYVPDVVTISLGQNDGVQDSTTFCSAYVDFIGEIRDHYPDATIILLNSPMADNGLNNILVEYTAGIAAYLNGQGDNQVYSFELSHNFNNGCSSHPDMEQHEIIAGELTDFISTIMVW